MDTIRVMAVDISQVRFRYGESHKMSVDVEDTIQDAIDFLCKEWSIPKNVLVPFILDQYLIHLQDEQKIQLPVKPKPIPSKN
jgi:hypothetical protein